VLIRSSYKLLFFLWPFSSYIRAINNSNMKKRDFLKLSGTVAVGSMVFPMVSCQSGESEKNGDVKNVSQVKFELPELSYGHAALTPAIDERTMKIHHGKHHAGYVRKLNAAIEGKDKYTGKSLEEIVSNVDPSETGVRNNGGGHFNHSLFWNIMSPNGGGEPAGELAAAISSDFGSYNEFRSAFTAAAGLFGSGWAWLIVNEQGNLEVCSTPNQDNPLMKKVSETNGQPILGLDVWEHAYYLNYQNRRSDYIEQFFGLIDWASVDKMWRAAR